MSDIDKKLLKEMKEAYEKEWEILNEFKFKVLEKDEFEKQVSDSHWALARLTLLENIISKDNNMLKEHIRHVNDKTERWNYLLERKKREEEKDNEKKFTKKEVIDLIEEAFTNKRNKT